MDAPVVLTEADRATLAAAESVIESGLKTFWQVGRALAQVRDERLYRATHETFEDYCRKRWDMAHRRAYQFIDAAGVMEDLCTNGTQMVPDSERVTRSLTSLPPEERSPTWNRALDAAGGKQPTAKQVEQAARPPTTRTVLETADAVPSELAGIPFVDRDGHPMPPPKKTEKYFPSNGLQYAGMAISQLEKIQTQDKQRAQAFGLVRAWLDKQG